MDKRGETGWTVTPAGRRGRVKVTLDVGPRPLVAELTDEELDKVRGILADAAEAEQRNDYSRIRLRDALRATIDRDPFTTVPSDDAEDRQGLFPVWQGVIFVLIGVGFAIRNTNIWLQIAGVAFALIAVADLVRHGVRFMRRREAD